MFETLLLGAALGMGLPVGPAGTPYPEGRTFAFPDSSPALDAAPAAEAAPARDVTIALPASLFPSPSDQPPAAQKPAPKEYRRAMPSPFDSPPFPGSEYQGYPIIGTPPDFTMWPLMQALQGTYLGDTLITNKIRVYGWVTAEGNLSTSKDSNTPDSYWIRPNKIDMDQAVLRFERKLDTVQTDHIDWGFRSTLLYGIDYRYMTAGGWFSDQLLKHNQLYGFDPTEQYVDVYIPWVTQGMDRPRRPLDRLPGHRNAVRPGQLHGQPLAPVHLRHLHADGHHAHLQARATSGRSRRHPCRAPTWPPGTRAPCRRARSASAGSPRATTTPSTPG